MGEQFLADHARRFVIYRDEAYRTELQERNLFSDRPEIFQREFSCELSDGLDRLCPGDMVMVRKVENNLEILCGNRAIGKVTTDAAPSLFEAMALDQRCQGLVLAQVEAFSPIGGYFTIRCKKQEM